MSSYMRSIQKMPPRTWQSCFGYTKFVTSFLQLPPFATRPRQGYFTCSWYALTFIRVLILFAVEPPNALSAITLTWELSNTLKAFLSIAKKEEFDRYLNDVNEFLKATAVNPINDRPDRFWQIWEGEKPEKYGNFLTVLHIVVELLFLVPIYYSLITDLDAFIGPFLPIFSPYLASSAYTKWLYTIVDSSLDFVTIIHIVYEQLMYSSLIKFQICQMDFLKELLNEMVANGGKKQTENFRWWITCHQTALRTSENVKKLLEVFIAVNYGYLVAVVSFTVVWILTDSERGIVETIAPSIAVWLQLIEFGWLCNTCEQFNEAHQGVVEEVYNPDTVLGEKWKAHFYIMTTTGTQKEFRFTGMGMFTLSNENYKDLVMATYSFLTSCLSLVHPTKD